MSALPYLDVREALRTAGNRAGAIRVPATMRALASAKALSETDTALALARLVSPSIDTLTVRELEHELAALRADARSLACVLAATLAELPPEAKVAHQALVGVVGVLSAVIGAMVPWSVAIDVTVLQACRDAGFGSDALGDRDRREELVRRLARALGVPVLARAGEEDEATSAQKLRALDGAAAAKRARERAIAGAILAKLPAV